jgi:hypothetical protein
MHIKLSFVWQSLADVGRLGLQTQLASCVAESAEKLHPLGALEQSH